MNEIENVKTPEVEMKKMNFSTFQKAQKGMIATNSNAYGNSYDRAYRSRVREYTPEQIARIIERGSITEQQKLSRNYFYKDGYYKQIIIHYATLLKYVGLLIPNPGYGKSLSTPHIQKKYYLAMDYVEKMNLPVLLTNCALRALIDGSYYGIVIKIDKTTFSVLDLPSSYCRSRFKDLSGNDIIEFDVSYFNTIFEKEAREAALASYPKVISQHYRKWSKGKIKERWVTVPSGLGICFSFFDGRPFFLNVIPASIDYDKAVEAEQERDAEELRKIIVQKIPHLTDGRLVFEPEEAEEMHNGTVGMLRGNKNISVLTTYADVEAVVSKTSSDSTRNTLEQMLRNVYSQAGVSSQFFASTGSNTLNASIKNDISMMMYLGNKFSNFISTTLNSVHSNANISFKYIILPISIHNEEDYVNTGFKLASSGYSFLMPAIAQGLSQKDLVSIKELENDVLKLSEQLIPLSSSYTQGEAGTGEVGRPKLPDDQKSDKTIQNEESLDNQSQGGSSE